MKNYFPSYIRSLLIVCGCVVACFWTVQPSVQAQNNRMLPPQLPGARTGASSGSQALRWRQAL